MRSRTCLAILLLAALLSACFSAPTVSFRNDTPIPVAVRVNHGDMNQLIYVSPGGRKTQIFGVGESEISVTTIPSSDWVAALQVERKLLIQKLEGRGTEPGPPRLMWNEEENEKIQNEIDSIDQKLSTFFQAKSAGLKECSVHFIETETCESFGRPGYGGIGVVTIERRPDGSLVPQCLSPEVKDKPASPR